MSNCKLEDNSILEELVVGGGLLSFFSLLSCRLLLFRHLVLQLYRCSEKEELVWVIVLGFSP
jgi:hypothetical protein